MNIIDYTHLIPNQTKIVTKKIGITFHITTDNNKYQALNWFKNPNAKASAHFIIEKDGEIGMCVDPRHIAWHNGVVRNPTANIIKDRRGNPNKYMIGFEVVARKGEELTEEQITSIIFLTKKMCKENDIVPNCYNLIGHNEVNSIDKVFCPVSVYEVSYIIDRIKKEEQYNNNQIRLIEDLMLQLQEASDENIKLNKINKGFKAENEKLHKALKDANEEIERLSRMIRKDREKYDELKEMYQENLEELQKLR